MSIETVNQNSTCEWVDAAYSKRLWGQLLRRADSIPPNCRRSLLTVRKHANEVFQDTSKSRDWYVSLFVPAAHRALDLVCVMYDRNGRFEYEATLLRISEHAGERLFERLRTNSVADLFGTLRDAVVAFERNNAIRPKSEAAKVVLPYGTLHVVADAGLWVAKTFIPSKPH